MSNGLQLLISFVLLVLTPPTAAMWSPLLPLPQASIWLTLAKAFLVLLLPPVTFTLPVYKPKLNVWITLAIEKGKILYAWLQPLLKTHLLLVLLVYL